MPLIACVFAFTAFSASAGSAATAGPHCGDVLTASVVLTADLVCSGDGLTIPGFADVTLDLHGHSIIGSGVGQGVAIQPSRNEDPSRSTPGQVTVENGSVLGFEIGIRVENNFPPEPPGDTIVQLEHLFVTHNGTGIFAGGDGGGPITTLTDTTIEKNQADGIRTGHITWLRMTNDVVRKNGGDGIDASEDSLQVLRDSFVAHNDGFGARLEDTVASISGNVFLGNGGTGLWIGERVCSFFPFYFVSNNVAHQNAGGGMSMVFTEPPEFCPGLAPPPGNGNAAWKNGDFQCVLIVCATHPGHGRHDEAVREARHHP
jgi:hypothetical protein